MKDITTITIKNDPTKLIRGHQPHRSGAGKHQDKRTKRKRTRSSAFRAVIDLG